MSLRRFGRNELYDHKLPDRFANHAPGLHKWWAAWTRTNGMIVEHISPYQQKIVSPMFKDPIGKLKHKIVDNWCVYPGLSLLPLTIWWLDSTAEKLERESWP